MGVEEGGGGMAVAEVLRPITHVAGEEASGSGQYPDDRAVEPLSSWKLPLLLGTVARRGITDASELKRHFLRAGTGCGAGECRECRT